MRPEDRDAYVAAKRRHAEQTPLKPDEAEFLIEIAKQKIAEYNAGIDMLDAKAADLIKLTGGAGFVGSLLPKTMVKDWSPDWAFIMALIFIVLSAITAICVIRPAVRSGATPIGTIIDSLESEKLSGIKGLMPTAMLCQQESLAHVRECKANVLTFAYVCLATSVVFVVISVLF